MFSPADLPDVIPLFPLPKAILLPRGQLPLQIFEPRYLAMLDDCLKTDHRLIGMVQPRGDVTDGAEGAAPPLYEVGCAGRVRAFSETDDGRYMITLQGVCRFRIVELVEGFQPYLKARVDWSAFLDDLVEPEEVPGFQPDVFFDLLGRYLNETGLQTDWDAIRDAEPELLVHSLAMLLPFEVEEKQALLEAPDLAARFETLQQLLRFALHAGEDSERAMQ